MYPDQERLLNWILLDQDFHQAGFHVLQSGFADNPNNKFHLIIDEKEAEVVKRVFRLYF